MRALLGSATLLFVCAAAPSAPAAERAKVSLAYTQKGGTLTGCPDEETFRGLVSARLGYDPFVTDATLALRVELQRRGNEIVGRFVLTGEKNSDRSLRAGKDECFELATSMALAAAVAIDPDAVQAQAAAPAPAPEPKPEPAPQPRPPEPPPARPAAPPPPPIDDRFDHGVRLELAGLIPVGVVPAPRGGARLGGALDAGAFSLGVEAAFLFPSSEESRYGKVSAYVLHGSLVPCVHPDLGRVLLNFCAVASLGVMRSTASDVTRAEPANDLFATVGPRVGLTVMLSRAFGLGATADVPVTLSRVHLDIEEGGQRHEVWASSRVGFVGGLALVLRFQ